MAAIINPNQRGPKGDTGPTGPTGPAGLGTVTPNPAGRTLNTHFQPNATKATFVIYTVRLQVTNPLLVGQSIAQVLLRSDANPSPSIERARAEMSSSVGITVTVQMTQYVTIPLTYIVPAGHYVRLASSGGGTNSIALMNSMELTLG